MTYTNIDIDAIISAVEDDAKKSVSHVGPPEISANTVSVRLRSFKFEKINPTSKPVSINHVAYNNNTDQSTEARFPVLTTKTISTYSFSFTAGFKFGTKSTLEVSVPGVGKGAKEVSFELDFSATHTQTKTHEQSWTYDMPIPVPARSKVCADLVISQNDYDPKFTGEMVLTGAIEARARSRGMEAVTRLYVPNWLYSHKDKYDKIKFEFQESSSQPIVLGEDMARSDLPDLSLWPPAMKAIIPVEGRLRGVSGSDMRVDVHQVKVGEDCPHD